MATVLLLSAVLATDAPALAPSSTPLGDWTLIGSPRAVNATARVGNALYLGGSFTGIARRAHGVASFDAALGTVTGPATAQDELSTLAVTALEAAADGGMYVAGEVTESSIRRLVLLRYTPAGALDETFRAEATGRIADMELGANGSLYLAGDLATVGGRPRSGLAAVDAGTGAVLGLDQKVAGGGVTQIELGQSGTNLVYLAGGFTTVGGKPRARLAAVDAGAAGTAGTVTSWDPQVTTDGGGFAEVQALARVGRTVYVGGAFGRAGGQARRNLAAVRSDNGQALPWNPQPNAAVNDLEVDPDVGGSPAYVAGDFTRVDEGPTTGPARRKLAAIDAQTGRVLPWDPSPTDKPTALLVDAGSVYIGFSPGGLGIPTVGGAKRCGLGAVDATTGVATPWDPRVSNNNFACGSDGLSPAVVVALERSGANVWAGGDFDVANVRRRTSLAAVDLTTGEPLPWAPRVGPDDVSSVVRALAPSMDASRIYVGGRFSSINGQPRLNAAAVSVAGAADTAAAVSAWDPAPDNLVTALAVSADKGRVYVGGEFRRIGLTTNRPTRTRLAAVGASSGGVVVGWAPEPNGSVADLALAGGRLYVAGTFTRLGVPAAQDRAGVAALSEDTGAVETGWNAGLLPSGTVAATVDSLSLSATHVYVAGQFSLPAGGGANIAELEVATGTPTNRRPAVDGRVRRVTIDPSDGTAYLAGDFTKVEGASRNGAASVTAGGAVTGWDPSPTGSQANTAPAPGPIIVTSDRLLLSGQFTSVGGVPQSGFGLFGPAAVPVAIAPPTVTGTARVGNLLTCRRGRLGGGRATRTYAWLRDGTEIAGETTTQYRVVPEDQRAALSCRETATNAAGSVQQESDAVSVPGEKPVLDTPPAVAGQPFIGGTAQCTSGLWRNAPTGYEYQWLLDDAPLPGEVSSAHHIAASEEGHRLACEVVAVNESGPAPAARSAAVIVSEAPPSSVTLPRIAGEPRVGVTLTCEPGIVERGRSLSYQWLRDGAPLVGEVAATYVATSRDVSRRLTCIVTAANAGGSVLAESPAVVVVPSARSTGTGRRANATGDEQPASATKRRLVIDVRRVKVLAPRSIGVTVKVPVAGRLSVLIVTRPARGARPRAVARGTRTLRRAQTVTLKLKLGSGGRLRLVRAGKRGLRTSVSASYRATGGATAKDRATATLRAVPARR